MADELETQQLKEVDLQLPATSEAIADLRPGNIVFLTGVVYTAREGVYDRVLNDGDSLPADLIATSNVNFHCSPAASPKPCLLYTSPSPRDGLLSRMPSSA